MSSPFTVCRMSPAAAVCIGDRLVGCGKLTLFTPHDACFEGMRKDPQIAAHFIALLALRHPLDSVRFSTYVDNMASRREQGERHRARPPARARVPAADGLHRGERGARCRPGRAPGEWRSNG